MRVPLVIAALLALSACGKDGQSGTSQNVDEGMTADSIVSNDVTAIDAVTGDAANMAADVDMNFGNLDADSGDSNEVRPARPARSKPAPAKAAPPVESNPSIANTSANSE